MAELLVKLPEHQLPFFMALLERLQFVKVEKLNGEVLSREHFLADFEASYEEAKRHLKGEIKLPKLEDVLDEL